MHEHLLTTPLFPQPQILFEALPRASAPGDRSDKKWWNNQLYLDRVKPSPDIVRSYSERALAPEALAAMLRFDIEHLVREVSLAETVTTYTMRLTSEQFLGDGYTDESMEVMMSNFVQLLAEKGLNTSRALIEHIVFERVKQFLVERTTTSDERTDQPKPIVIITSPPDRVSAGYHGADSLFDFEAEETHHSFLYVMEVISEGEDGIEVKVTQYRTWHNMAGLLALHEELGSSVDLDTTLPVTVQLFANALIIENADQLASSEIHAQLQEVLYRDSADWARRPEQAPRLPNREQFDSEWRAFFEHFYLPRALELYQLARQENKPLTDSQILEQLEILFSFFLRAIEKRVQELNTNPLYAALLEKQIMQDMIKHPDKVKDLERQLLALKKPSPPQTLQERQSKISKAYSLQVKSEVLGEKLTAQEAAWYNTNLTRLVSISNFAMGSASCYALAPFTTAVQISKSVTSSAEALNIFSKSLESISLTSRQELYQDLQNLDYVELKLSGAQRVYMVPKSYLEAPGCRVNDHGQVLGPCDIDLDEDPLAFAMNQQEFAVFMQQLAESISVDETLETVLSVNSEEEKNKLRPLVEDLYRKLFKQSVGIQALLATSAYQFSLEAYALPPEILTLLRHATNPFAILLELLAQADLSEPELLAA